MGDPVANDLRPSHDWQKLVLFVLACAGAVYAFGDKILQVGKTSASIEKIDRIEQAQVQMQVDGVRTKLQAENANAAILRVEEKVDNMNAVLMQINITGHHR